MSLSSPILQMFSPEIIIKLENIAFTEAEILVTAIPGKCFGKSCSHERSNSGINSALFDIAGVRLKKSCQMIALHQNIVVGDVVETPGFHLNCKAVYHILLAKYDGSNERSLQNAIEVCLNKAEKNKFSSIAFPAIGTGSLRYSVDMLALWYKKKFLAFKAKYLRKIYIILYPADSLAINVFSKVFMVSNFPALIDRDDEQLNESQPRKRSRRSAKSSNFRLAVKQDDLVVSECEAIVNPVSSDFKLDGSPLSSHVLAYAGSAIEQSCANNPVRQSLHYRVTEGGKLKCRYIIHVASPTKSNALEAMFQAVLSLAEDDLRIQSLAIPAVSTGNAGLSSAEVAKALAAALENFKEGKPLYLHEIEVVIFNPVMLSDFEDALAGLIYSGSDSLDTSSRKSTPKRRKQSEKSGFISDGLPLHWEPMKGEQWKTVQLLSSSKEYMDVLAKFSALFKANLHVVTIERIQNPLLYKQFVVQRTKIEGRLMRSIVTKELFHGTKADVCPYICKDGFDRGHSGENGAVYGNGTYFATTSEYSHNFAIPDHAGCRHMFLADVIVGDYCLGSPDMKVAPLKPLSFDHFDSVVDALPASKVFVIFKDTSAYPLYLLKYV